MFEWPWWFVWFEEFEGFEGFELFEWPLKLLKPLKPLFFTVVGAHEFQQFAGVFLRYILVGHAYEALFEQFLSLFVLFQHHFHVGNHVHDPYGFAFFGDAGPARAYEFFVAEFVAGQAFGFVYAFAGAYPVFVERAAELHGFDLRAVGFGLVGSQFGWCW